jgi:hypothetical protein
MGASAASGGTRWNYSPNIAGASGRLPRRAWSTPPFDIGVKNEQVRIVLAKQ